jgi:hypothetical protein
MILKAWKKEKGFKDIFYRNFTLLFTFTVMLLLLCFLDNWRMASQQSLLVNWYEPRNSIMFFFCTLLQELVMQHNNYVIFLSQSS